MLSFVMPPAISFIILPYTVFRIYCYYETRASHVFSLVLTSANDSKPDNSDPSSNSVPADGKQVSDTHGLGVAMVILTIITLLV